MGEHALISFDLKNLKSLTSQGLEWETISIIGRVLIDVSPDNFDEATSFVRRHVGRTGVYCDVTTLGSVLDIVSLLDNGATKVFLSRIQFNEIVEKRMLADTDRLIVCVDGSYTRQDDAAAMKTIQENLMIGGKLLKNFKIMDADSNSQNSMERFQEPPLGLPTLYVSLANNSLDEYLRAIRSGFTPIVSSQKLTAEPAKNSHLIPIHQLVTHILRSDRSDGLYPTVVTDENGVCLGLVYSNEESVETALRLRRGVYYSRSRQGLWIKGEESGDIQQLVRIEWDCDGDALRFTVRQQGNGK